MGLLDSFSNFPHVWNPSFYGSAWDQYSGKNQSDAIREANAVSLANADKNIAMQREFAQNGLRWKVEDAKAAGIHPLMAMGASPASFSPVSVGVTPDTAQADSMVRMGQDISRAMSSTSTASERQMQTLNVQGAQLDLQGKALDNQIKQSQLTKMEQTGPAFPGSSSFISGQGDSGPGIVEKPLERTRSLKGAPQSEPGAIPDVGWAKTKTGVVPVPSQDVKQRIEDNMPQEFSHYWRNNVAPNWGGGTQPPKSALPKGATDWQWSHRHQEFQPYYPKYKFETNPRMR